ncbi:MAG: pyrrolidone-carboxylate peptidase [Thermoplasmata archaeon YP2-bin.285]|uniref:Pyroglutamyl-peptidase I n=1 Tax=Candidatus Sysuiplasma superficiale TaxID=2823368 RepID=A0A8J7YKS1_9ARCH|nr:pyrrolidone-carboxylate peptidase [Candidatus Sysuiplasma superficiale]
MSVILFGFEPFGEFRENPSQKAVSMLDGERIGGMKAEAVILRVDYPSAERTIMRVFDARRPLIAVGTGLAAGRNRVSVEKVAINFMSYPGMAPESASGLRKVIDPAGPDGIFPAVDVERMADFLNGRGIPSAVSLSAGSYLCNFAMYLIMRECRNRGIKGCFLHLPCDQDMALKGEYSKYPYMSLEVMTDAIRGAVEFCAGELRGPHLHGAAEKVSGDKSTS